MGFDQQTYLNNLGTLSDDEIQPALAAIALASVKRKGLKAERYGHHLDILVNEVGARFQELLEAGAEDNAETRLAALKHILHDTHHYHGNEKDYNALDNADLISVIDTKIGLPIALSLLYIHAGRAQDWDILGLNFPGHFLCRLDLGAQRVIFDPFYGCKILEASDLRNILKRTQGPEAELSNSYYEPASNRDILFRLQNNIKSRQIDMEDYKGALETIEISRHIDPNEYRLSFDAGILYARNNQPDKAIKALEHYIENAPRNVDKHDAALIIKQIIEQSSDEL